VVTDDADLAARVRALRSFGERGGAPPTERGTNSRLDSLQAAILAAKLPRLERWNERRRELAARYLDALRGLALALPEEAAGRRHVYHLFVVRALERDRIREELARRGIETLVHYPHAVHENPAYRGLARQGRLVRSERACREVFSLPLYPELGDDELDDVVAAMHEALRA
jgi:dTDP-3-amino-3,4,6-trideoxy-alpha-D-glucose transaminase